MANAEVLATADHRPLQALEQSRARTPVLGLVDQPRFNTVAVYY